ncbi:MAG TPA: PKD-like domain-containing protein, partial [Bacteroidales bacterium]|nr:PKD-like domain-containing protein [Bacteroidales bacterium]
IVLAGNVPAIGTGTWSLLSGPAGGTVNFTGASGPNTPAATATVNKYGEYTFRWTLVNGGCSTTDDVIVSYNPSGQVNQPTPQVICNGDPTALVAFTTTNTVGTTTYAWTNSAPGIGLAASGTGDIASFNAVNGGTSPITATIVVTPTTSDGVVNCPGPTKTFTITVNPTAQVNKPANQVVCNSGSTTAVTFGTNRTGGTTTYTWTNDNPGINLAASGSGNIASFSPVNLGTGPVTATITVQPTFTNGGTSCPGPTESFTITVNPSGQVDLPVNLAICNTQLGTVTFTTDRTGGVTTYAWTNSAPGIGLPASGSGDISFTGVNVGTAPVTANIQVTPTFTAGGVSCTGPPKNFTITVNPTAQVNKPANQEFCNGATGTVNFTTTRTGGTTTYYWTNDNLAIGLGADGSGNISFLATNAGIIPITANITVTPTFNFGGRDCPGPTETFTITIKPTPVLSSSLTPPDICSNTVFSYNPASLTAGTTFSWTRAVVAGITPAGPTSGTDNPNETLRNVTNIPIGVTYHYTLAAAGCSNSQDVVVNIKPEPVVTPGQVSDICSGNTTNYHILLNNFINPVDNVVFTWPSPVLAPADPRFTGGTARLAASAVNIADVFTNTMGVPGTATYTVTPFKNGCAGTPQTIVFTIRSQPVLSGSLNKTICSSVATQLILDVAAGSVSSDFYNIISRTLDPGLSVVVAVPVGVGLSDAVSANYLFNDIFRNITGVDKNVRYRIQPVHAPDCFGAPVDVVITIRPEPYILPAQAKTVCSGVAIGKEILLSPANTPAGTIFNWLAPPDAMGQGTAGVNVAADPAGKIHINDVITNYTGLPMTATYTITPTSAAGCAGAPIPVVITVNPEPVPGLIGGRNKLCINETNIIYQVPAVPGSMFHWTLDPAIGTKTFDFNTNAIIINSAAAPGWGNITYYETNSFGCDGDVSTYRVDVYDHPAAEPVTGDAVVCANSTHTYSVTARVGSTYSWTIPGSAAIIGDPSGASVQVVFANVGGNISVRETTIGGCVRDHIVLPVTVKPLPTALLTGGGTICDGGSINLFVDFAGTGPFDFVYAINGVPQPPVSTSSDPYTLTATAAGTYTIVNVSDATGCNNTGFGSSLVSYYVKPTGTISGGATICGGATTTLTMTFTGTTPFSFSYTDGTTTFNVPNYPDFVYTTTVTPATTRTYTLTSLTDGHSCTGLLSGSAAITINIPPTLTLAGTNLTCFNDNTGAVNLTATGSSPFGYVWSGPLGFTANTEDISGLKAGTYIATVTDTKGCTSTGSVTLSEPGTVTATLASTNIFCFGAANGTITISAPGGGSGIFQYTIDGGLTWGASGSFTGLNPGTYDVRIRDAAAPVCNKILDAALVITGPPVLSAVVSKTDIICNGSANGTITISSPA